MLKPSKDVAIRLSGVSKRYTIHHEKPTLVERLTNGRDEEFWVYPEKCEPHDQKRRKSTLFGMKFVN